MTCLSISPDGDRYIRQRDHISLSKGRRNNHHWAGNSNDYWFDNKKGLRWATAEDKEAFRLKGLKTHKSEKGSETEAMASIEQRWGI